MKKLYSIVLVLLILVGSFAGSVTPVQAASCGSLGWIITSTTMEQEYYYGNNNSGFTIELDGINVDNLGDEYKITIDIPGTWPNIVEESDVVNGKLSFTFDSLGAFLKPGIYYVELDKSGGDQSIACDLATYRVNLPNCSGMSVSTTDAGGQQCYGGTGACLLDTMPVKFTANLTISDGSGNPYANRNVQFIIDGNNDNNNYSTTNANGLAASQTDGPLPAGNHTVEIYLGNADGTFDNEIWEVCSAQFSTAETCDGECSEDNPIVIVGNSEADPFVLCEQIDENLVGADGAGLRDKCIQCVGGSGPDSREGIWTAIGCIKREPAQIAKALITVGISMGGGVALLMILVAGFVLTTSQGDPKRTAEGREMLTAAITGLLFIVFSVTILEFIGYSVLRIPGFGGTI